MIATDTLSVGWDSQYTWNVVLLCEPDDVDEFVQKIQVGHIGCNHKAVSHPQAFLYYTWGALAKAQAIVSEKFKGQGGQNAAQKGDAEEKMDVSMAWLLTAPCIPDKLNVLFNNPTEDDKCLCCKCQDDPPVQQPSKCNCSGSACKHKIAEELSTTQVPPMLNRAHAQPGETMQKEVWEHGTKHFKDFWW